MPAARTRRAVVALERRPPLPGHLRRRRIVLGDGARTTVYVAEYRTAEWVPRLALLRRPWPLEAWCAERGIGEAIVGGFFTRSTGIALGELRTRGMRRRYQPFSPPFAAIRACAGILGGELTIAARDLIPAEPRGDLLQAGPLLVRDGARAIRRGVDPEGFSAGQRQFDSDITRGRYPRAALALTDRSMLAVACDGRGRHDAGLTLSELADALIELGAHTALNLDGGGSTSLVCGAALRNRPREEHGIDIPGGRPVTSALVFEPRA